MSELLVGVSVSGTKDEVMSVSKFVRSSGVGLQLSVKRTRVKRILKETGDREDVYMGKFEFEYGLEKNVINYMKMKQLKPLVKTFNKWKAGKNES